MDPDRIFFKTDLFEVEEGEDAETNPEIYGKQFASWLKSRFSDLGYDVGEIIPEDWGWCVMCERNPDMLWVGCASFIDGDVEEGKLPDKKDIIWHCFATSETPLLKRLFSKGSNQSKLEKLKQELEQVIHEEVSFKIVQEPT